MAGRRDKLTKDKFLDALKKAHGLKTGAADILGVVYNTVDRYCKKYAKEADEIIAQWDIRRTERAIYKLDEAIERGDSWAVGLQVKQSKEGRKRGYGDSIDVTSGGEKIESKTVIYLPNNGRS